MTAYRKKMIEVALPLEAINKASAKEKSIRHGHPSTLHLWWARRPLAACRAVLFASLVDDPDSDPMFAGDEDIAASKRAELFNLIEDLVLWENSNNPRVINRARAEIARCVATQKIEEGVFGKDDELTIKSPLPPGEGKGEGDTKAAKIKVSVFEIRQLLAKPEQVNAFLAEYAPPVLDPFCGGGSIPLEAQRLGLRAYGSDLNPVPVLITKALIEILPKFAGLPPVNPEWQKKSKEEKAATVWRGAQGLAEDVRYYGKWMRDEAEKRIGHLYPKVKITEKMAKDRPDLKEYAGRELTVIAWLWARTVASQDPSCSGAHVPIIKSFNISRRGRENVWIEPCVDRATNTYSFQVRTTEAHAGTAGTVNRRGVRCLLSGTPIPFGYVRSEGKAGRLGTRLLAVIADENGHRVYLPPLADHETPICQCQPESYPDTEMAFNPFSLRPPLYGLRRFADLFTNRQLVALDTFCRLVGEVRQEIISKTGNGACANAIATYLAFAISKCSDYWNTIATWMPRGTVGHAFSKQAIPMTWDYPEANPFADFHCSWTEAVNWVAKVIEMAIIPTCDGEAVQADATLCTSNAPQVLFSTDPPYYSNIDYADLSDFFYVWLRRSLTTVYPSLFSTIATPKAPELVASPYRFDGDATKARQFFEEGLTKSFARMKAEQVEGYPTTVFYAFKQTESEDDNDTPSETNDEVVASTGWETMLEGLIRSGFLVDGTWPIRTERSARTMSIGMNALASSIVLVCRPRSVEAPLATRKDFITALRRELPDALRDLQHGNVAPVDLAQAAIGPGMAVFTRYFKVMETDGSAMTVRTSLGLINQALDEVLAEQEGEFDGDTRWALAWFEQFGMEEGPFGVAETLSKAKNTSVGGLVEAGFLRAQSGKVRLLRREELDAEWDPATDKRLTMWEITQYLIRKLEQEGESAAAVLVHKLGGMAEAARDLAYRLYSICERKKWATEALSYNGLVIAWPELTKLAIGERSKAPAKQSEMF